MNEIIAIIAVAVGWVLSELSIYLRGGKARKEAVASALSILLEVRFRIICFDSIVSLFKEHGVQGGIAYQVRNILERIIPEPEEISSSYEESIRTLSKVAPLIAYEFRSKNSFMQFMSNWRHMATEHGVDAIEIESLEIELKSVVLPEFNKMVIKLAELHSRASAKEVKKLVSSNIKIPAELKSIMQSINANKA